MLSVAARVSHSPYGRPSSVGGSRRSRDPLRTVRPALRAYPLPSTSDLPAPGYKGASPSASSRAQSLPFRRLTKLQKTTEGARSLTEGIHEVRATKKPAAECGRPQESPG